MTYSTDISEESNGADTVLSVTLVDNEEVHTDDGRTGQNGMATEPPVPSPKPPEEGEEPAVGSDDDREHVQSPEEADRSANGLTMRLQISDINVPKKRACAVDPDNVAQLGDSIKLNGGLLQRILVRKVGNKYFLVCGAARLEALKLLGHTEVECDVRDYSELQAELAEIDGNLMRGEQNPAQRILSITRREAIIAALGLRAKSGDNQHTKRGGADSAPPKTTAGIAKETGMSKRTYQVDVQIGKQLDNDTLDALASTKHTKEAIKVVAKMEPELRKAVVAKLKTGEANTVVVARRIITRERMKNAPLLDSNTKYRVLYADCPWRYGSTSGNGAPEVHYPTLSIAELCALIVNGKHVRELAADNSVLFFWVPVAMSEVCYVVIKAWGFEYASEYIWDKVRPAQGVYGSVRHERLLVCTRGSCTPEVDTLFDSVQVIERSNKHSEKPERFREIIDTLYPSGRRIELFARKTVPGWDAWGDEIPGILHIG